MFFSTKIVISNLYSVYFYSDSPFQFDTLTTHGHRLNFDAIRSFTSKSHKRRRKFSGAIPLNSSQFENVCFSLKPYNWWREPARRESRWYSPRHYSAASKSPKSLGDRPKTKRHLNLAPLSYPLSVFGGNETRKNRKRDEKYIKRAFPFEESRLNSLSFSSGTSTWTVRFRLCVVKN